MPRIRAQFSVDVRRREIGAANRAPLRYAYIRQEPFGPTYITDINGIVRDQDGNEGIDSLTNSADITIYCQNSVAHVLDANDILQRCPTVSFRITRPFNGGRATGTITSSVPAFRHFRLLNQIYAAYHLVWRQFEPFRSGREFPLGRSRDLEATRNRIKRIEVMFPSPASALPGLAADLGINLPPNMDRLYSFTDPMGTQDGYPRIYVESDPPETRLFSGSGSFSNGNRKGLELVPSELAHALHFSLLSKAQREKIRSDYLGFIVTQLANDLSATHHIGALTNPMVAFLEAFDHFSHRLSEHVRARLTTFPSNPLTARYYVINEARGLVPVEPRVARIQYNLYGPGRRIKVRPNEDLTLHGSLDEGAIFGGLFIDLALRVGLKEVVEVLLESKKINFGQFRNFINRNRPDIVAELDEVVDTWGL